MLSTLKFFTYEILSSNSDSQVMISASSEGLRESLRIMDNELLQSKPLA